MPAVQLFKPFLNYLYCSLYQLNTSLGLGHEIIMNDPLLKPFKKIIQIKKTNLNKYTDNNIN